MMVYVVEQLEGIDDVSTLLNYRGAFASWEEAEEAAGVHIPRNELYGRKITTHGRYFEEVRIIPMEVGKRINRC